MKHIGKFFALFVAMTMLMSGTCLNAFATESGKYSVKVYLAKDLTLLPDGSIGVYVYTVNPGMFTMPDAPTRSGFAFSSWQDGDATYLPGETLDIISDRVFYAQWTTTYPFTDLEEAAEYFYDVIDVYERGLMTGTSATTFSPNNTFTRAMIWTVLARMDGAETGGDPWYAKAQAWAMKNNISDGTAPDREMSLQELITLLYRTAGSPTVKDIEQFAAFPGAERVADWAKDAMWWGLQTDIYEFQQPELDSTGTVNRSEVATAMARFCALTEAKEAVLP